MAFTNPTVLARQVMAGLANGMLLFLVAAGLSLIFGVCRIIKLLALKSSGKTVLLSEQNLNFSLRLADRAYLIDKGEIKYAGTTEDLRNNEQIRREYLML